MPRKKRKPWYKKGWFYTILIVIALVFVAQYFNNQTYYEIASKEHEQIYSQTEMTSNQINEIEIKYSGNGLVYYYEFSEEDLSKYLLLLTLQEENYDELIAWIISNEKYLKSEGQSDLAISESIKELHSLNEKISEARLQVGSIQKFQTI